MCQGRRDGGGQQVPVALIVMHVTRNEKTGFFVGDPQMLQTTQEVLINFITKFHSMANLAQHRGYPEMLTESLHALEYSWLRVLLDRVPPFG